MSSDAPRLPQLFRAAHEGDRPAPDFDRLLRRRPESRRRSLSRWVPIAAAAALIAVVAMPLLEMRREKQALEFARELAAWRAPTDALLSDPYRPSGLLEDFAGASVLGATDDMIRWRR